LVLNISEVSTIADLFHICSARGSASAGHRGWDHREGGGTAAAGRRGVTTAVGKSFTYLSDRFVPEEGEFYRLERL
jgi:hypothetical protein